MKPSECLDQSRGPISVARRKGFQHALVPGFPFQREFQQFFPLPNFCGKVTISLHLSCELIHWENISVKKSWFYQFLNWWVFLATCSVHCSQTSQYLQHSLCLCVLCPSKAWKRTKSSLPRSVSVLPAYLQHCLCLCVLCPSKVLLPESESDCWRIFPFVMWFS